MSAERVSPPRLSLYCLHYLGLLALAFTKQNLADVIRIRQILTPKSPECIGYRNEIDRLVRWGIATQIRSARSLTSQEDALLATLFVMYVNATAWAVSERVCDRMRVVDRNVREDVSQLTVVRVLFLLGTPMLGHIRDARGLTSTLRLLARQSVRFSQPSRIQSYEEREDRVLFSVFTYNFPVAEDAE